MQDNFAETHPDSVSNNLHHSNHKVDIGPNICFLAKLNTTVLFVALIHDLTNCSVAFVISRNTR